MYCSVRNHIGRAIQFVVGWLTFVFISSSVRILIYMACVTRAAHACQSVEIRASSGCLCKYNARKAAFCLMLVFGRIDPSGEIAGVTSFEDGQFALSLVDVSVIAMLIRLICRY